MSISRNICTYVYVYVYVYGALELKEEYGSAVSTTGSIVYLYTVGGWDCVRLYTYVKLEIFIYFVKHIWRYW